MNNENYLTPEEASQLTGIPMNSLAVLRSKKQKFPFYKIGGYIRYKKSEVIEVIENGKINVEKED